MTGAVARCAAAAALVWLCAGPAAAQVTPAGGSVGAAQATSGALPLTLDEAVARGLQYNLRIISSELQVESARGSRLRTLRELLPRVDARAGDTRQTVNLAAFGFDASLFPGIPSIVGPFNLFDARVAGSQTLFDLSAVNDVRSKTAAFSAAQFDAMNARDTVTFVVTRLYFAVAGSNSRVETVQSQVNTAEALLTQATTLRDAGVAPGIDVVRAQVQLQVQRERLIQARSDAVRRTLDLVRAIGVPTGQPVTLVDRDRTLQPPALTLDEAIATAADRRPDYRASLERLRAAQSSLDAARTDYLPTVRVNADWGAIGSSPSDARRTYSMSASVSVPVFDADRGGRRIENEAALRQRQAEAADLAQQIEADVRTAFLDMQAADEQLAVARERRALAERELSLARIRFTAGVTNNLEVIQAQDEVAVANDVELTATFAVNVARASLTRAIGSAAPPSQTTHP